MSKRNNRGSKRGAGRQSPRQAQFPPRNTTQTPTEYATPKVEFEWIDTPEALQELWHHIWGCGIVAVDTESNNYHVYNPKTCLIQIGTKDRIALLDVLALPPGSLDGLAAILEDPDTLKIMHAGHNDIIGLMNDFDFEVRGLFDTEVAARFAQSPKTGLDSLLNEQFGIKLSKKYQCLDWEMRPLPHEALEYAALDVAYLLPLREQLLERLGKVGLKSAAEETSEWITTLPVPEARRFDIENFRKIKGWDELHPQNRGVLREIYRWRHEVCKELNRSALFVANNLDLLLIARKLPRNRAELLQIPRLDPLLIKERGEDILTAVRRGLKATPPPKRRPPKKPTASLSLPMTRTERDRYDHLRKWRGEMAEKDTLIPLSLITTNNMLNRLARALPQTMEELAEDPEMLPWRLERFGKSLLRTLQKRLNQRR